MGRMINQALPLQLSLNDDGVDGIIIYRVGWPSEPPMYFMTKPAAERAARMEHPDEGTVEEITVWNDPLGDDKVLTNLRGE